MGNNKYKDIGEKFLSLAGIKINGDNPWDVKIHDDRLYKRVLADGSLGLGESYMDGWWDCEALDELVNKLLRTNFNKKVLERNWKMLLSGLIARVFNFQSKARAFKVGEKHYDLGDDLYEEMLDKRMLYTCAYWKNATNLDEAQEHKLDLICRKIGIRPGMAILDLGCGWGGFEKFAAEKYGANVVGLTISKNQVHTAKKANEGLPVEIRLQDYRTVEGKYDRVISIGFIEHIGHKNYRTFMEVVNRCLKDDGIVFIHTIGRNTSVTRGDLWTTKYIFPNCITPSISQLTQAMEGLFALEDLHNIGPDYDLTLMAWYRNFNSAWPKLKDKYGERFRRMWNYWLLLSAGGFRSRHLQLWQIVMTKPGTKQPECRIT